MRERDNQKSKVYHWEQTYLFKLKTNTSLSLTSCEKIITDVCLARNIRVPTIKDGRGRKTACACYSSVSLPRWARNKVITLHEVTHTILDNGVRAWHGPEFAALFIELLDKYNVSHRKQSVACAKKCGVKIK